MIPIPAPGRRMIVPVFLLLMLFSSGSHARDIRGVIDADSLWTAAESPVNLTGDILVAEGATLTIEPGVLVVFQTRPDTTRGYTLTVEGALVARGEEGLPIVFTAADRNAPWGAIIFEDPSEDWDEARESGSVISGCVVEYGGNDPDGGNAMILTRNAMPLIAGNAVRFSKAAGIAATVTGDAVSLSGNVRIIDNQIYRNETGLIFSAEGGVVEGNYFLDNDRAVEILTRSNTLDLRQNTVAVSADKGALRGAAVSLQLGEPSNGITAYRWEQTAGTPVVIEDPNSPRISFDPPNPGVGLDTLRFNLTVTGPSGTATESVELTVVGLNEPPVAAAGGDINVELPEDPSDEVRITLNGSGSHDPYIGIAGYRWEQVSGAGVNLETPNAVETEFVMPTSVRAGDRMAFRLTVTDQLGLASSDEVEVIYYRDNIFPVATAGEDFKTLQGQIVSLDGSGSRDADGGIAAYLWEQTGGTPVELINFFTAKPIFVAPEVEGSGETLTFRLRVLDTGGLQDEDEISVQVKGATVSLPGDDRTVSAFAPVILDGRGSFDQRTSADVRIEGNRFTSANANAGLVAVTATENARWRLKISGNALEFAETPGYGAYLFDWPDNTANIDMMDNWWGTDDPAVIEGMVFDQADDFRLPAVIYQPFAARPIPGAGSDLTYPPLADAGADIENVSVDRNVTLDGSRSYDPDGIALYQWRQTEGTPVTIRDANAPVASFVAPPGGGEGRILRFTLTVSTGGAFSHTDEVAVQVNPDPPVAVVDAGSGCFIQTATSPWTMGNKMKRMLMIALAGTVSGLLFWRKRAAFILTAVLAASLILGAGPADAGFFAVGGGAGGDADEFNITLESGARGISAGNLDLMFAVGVPFIPHGDDNLPDPTISSPCPSSVCVDAGEERKGTEVGFYGKLGVELGASNVYLNAIAGFTVYTESSLSRSEASGAYYEESSDTTIDPLYGIGVSYFAENFQWPIVLQLDVDVIRGVTGTIGWYW